MLSSARAQPLREEREALLKIRRDLGDLKTVQRSLLIELMSSFRDAEAFEELVELYNSFPGPLKEYVIVKQQFALALNRRNQSDDRERALRILNELLKNRGPDSETLGVKGRIHKDTYKEATQAGRITAAAALDDAIEAYTKGFEADPRDYYPGVNAINLLIQKGDAESLKKVERLLPLVSFAVEGLGGATLPITGIWPPTSNLLVLVKIGRPQIEYSPKRSLPRRTLLRRQRPLAICVYSNKHASDGDAKSQNLMPFSMNFQRVTLSSGVRKRLNPT